MLVKFIRLDMRSDGNDKSTMHFHAMPSQCNTYAYKFFVSSDLNSRCMSLTCNANYLLRYLIKRLQQDRLQRSKDS